MTQSLTTERLSGTKPAQGNLGGLVVLGGKGGHIVGGGFWTWCGHCDVMQEVQ